MKDQRYSGKKRYYFEMNPSSVWCTFRHLFRWFHNTNNFYIPDI